MHRNHRLQESLIAARGRLAVAVLGSVLGLASPPSVSTAALDSGAWPMFHRDTSHAAFTSLPAPLSSNLAWSAAVSDSIEFSSPVITSSGRILIGDAGKELTAFNAFGNEIWHYHTGGNLRYGTAAVASDGTIYVGSGDSKLYALTPNGGLKWAVTTGGAVKTAPAIAPDGTVYVGGDDGKLWAINPDGSVKWTYVAGDTIRSSPAVGTDFKIYFGCHDGVIRALYPSGQLAWSGATGGAVRAAPAIYRGQIIVPSADGFLYSIREDGALEWATFTGENMRSTPAIGITGKIYLGMDTKIACYHDNGLPCWEFETNGRVLSSPAVTAGIDSLDVVLCGSDSGVLYCLKDGGLQWSATIGTAIRSSPAIGPNGRAYVGAADGRLYCFGTTSPADVETVDLAGRLRLSLWPNPATLRQPVRVGVTGAAAGRDGKIAIFDVAGRRVRTFAAAGQSRVSWDGRDESGRPLPAGIYLARWSNGVEGASAHLVRLR